VQELRSVADRLVEGLDLEQVFVASCSFETGDTTQEPPFTTDTTIQVMGSKDGSHIETRSIHVTEAVKEASDGDKVLVWEAKVECVAVFSGENAETLSEDDLEALAIIVGSQTLHPYARDMTQILTSHSAYPALTLGLLIPAQLMSGDVEVELPDRTEN
jgi:preprotein translocase subunit SecB